MLLFCPRPKTLSYIVLKPREHLDYWRPQSSPTAIGDPQAVPTAIGDPQAVPTAIGDLQAVPTVIGDLQAVPTVIGGPDFFVELPLCYLINDLLPVQCRTLR